MKSRNSRHARLIALLTLGIASCAFIARINGGASASEESIADTAAERLARPLYVTTPAAEATDLTPAMRPSREQGSWSRSNADAANTRYSPLTQINTGNVASLKVAWIYHSGDGAGQIQANPIVVNGVIYTPTPGKHIVALDAATGKERWRFKAGKDVPSFYNPAHRGLLYWPGDRQHAPRLYFTDGQGSMLALDSATGKLVRSFGEDGKVPSTGPIAPAIFRNVLVMANLNIVEAFDVVTGGRIWRFELAPGALKNPQMDLGASAWAGMAMDVGRGIAYVSTSSMHPNFNGVDRPGRNRYANSVVALDAVTGKLVWSFQEVAHDIWDLDIPAPPNLVTIDWKGRRVDAVAQVTKLGNTLLLDRLTGKPLFPVRYRRAPVSTVPGEQTWPYQPDIELPQPFARQEFSEKDITTLTPSAHAFVLKQVRAANHGWFEPFEPGKLTVYYNVQGGAQWSGAGFDPSTGILYVNSSDIAWLAGIQQAGPGAKRDPHAPPSAGETVYLTNCAGCHGQNREGMGMAPSLLGLKERVYGWQLIELLKHGGDVMPPIPLGAADRDNLMAFLYDNGAGVMDAPPGVQTARSRYVLKDLAKLFDDRGYPGTKPPWGTLNAINLSTGRILWKVPLGEYPELTRQGIPRTGTQNFGGATVTAGGLVFVAGTTDARMRAFDKKTGQELWQYDLPYAAYSAPSTYEVNGRQYVVIAATGGGGRGGGLVTKRGDAFVAFALP